MGIPKEWVRHVPEAPKDAVASVRFRRESWTKCIWTWEPTCPLEAIE